MYERKLHVLKSYRLVSPRVKALFALFPTRFAKDIKHELRKQAHVKCTELLENTGTPGISSPNGLASGKFTRSCTFALTHPNSILREPGGWPGVIRRRGVSRSRYRSVNPCCRRLFLGSLAIGSALAQHHDFRVVARRPRRKEKRKDDDIREYVTKNISLRIIVHE